MKESKGQSEEGHPIQIHQDHPIIPKCHNFNTNRLQSDQITIPVITQNPTTIPIIPTNLSLQESTEQCYNQYRKLLRQNYLLNNQLQFVTRQKNQLAQKHNLMKKMNSQEDEKRKRHRRNANQIPRQFNCPYPKCEKGYGSEGSLTQHVKLKHSQFFNSGEYEINNQHDSHSKKQSKQSHKESNHQ